MSEYLVWSNEHGCWWGPERAGYVRRVKDAGRYTHAEALDICTDSIPGTSLQIGMLPELPVRLEDVTFMLQRFAGTFPGHDPEPRCASPDYIDKLTAAEARERVLREALALAVDYDNLLLRFKGPAVLYDGDNKAIDAAYDKWVAAARAALKEGGE